MDTENNVLFLNFPEFIHIDDAIKHCFDTLSGNSRITTVKFEFNGVEIEVNRDKTPETVYKEYITELENLTQLRPSKPKKDNPFYMVFVKDGDSPKYKHYDYNKAVEEATRLARLTKKEVFVLGTIDKVVAQVNYTDFKVKELKCTQKTNSEY